jgi:hypothetical protein
MTTAGVEFTELDGNLGVTGPSGRRPVFLMGAADAGAYNTPVALTRKQQARDLLTGGPLLKACLYFLAKGLVVVPCRSVADLAGTCGAVTSTSAASNKSIGTIDASHNTPTVTANVKVLFPIGGTVGVAGPYYQVGIWNGSSYDYGVATALSTATHIVLATLGDVWLDLSHTGGSDSTIDAGGYYTFSTTAVAAGSIGTITDNGGGGEAAITHNTGSTCNDAYEVEVDFPTGGTQGTAGIKWRYRLGPLETMKGPFSLGVATTITIPATGGLVLDIAAGTIAAGRALSFRTEAPGVENADLEDSLDAMLAYHSDFEVIMPVGPVDSTDFASLEEYVAAMPDEPDGRDRIAICSWRKPDATEADSTYQAAFAAAMGSSVSTDGFVTVGAGGIKLAVDGTNLRREFGWALAAAVAGVDPGVDPSQRVPPGGALLGCSLLDANGNPDDHDESYTPGLRDKRANCGRTWSDKAGAYIEPTTRTFAAEGSDWAMLVHRRVANVAKTALRTYMRDQIAIGLDVDVTTGFLLPEAVALMNANATAVVKAATRGMLSKNGARVTFATDDKLDAEDSVLHASLDLVSKFYPRRLAVTVGLRSKL